MRKWLFFLVILVVIVLLSKINQKREVRAPFGKRFSETLSVIAWAMIIAYVASFIYWLYTQIFR